MAFRFLQGLFGFPQQLSDFPQRLSDVPQWLSSFREIQENLFTVASIQKITTQASYFPPLAPQAS
jgi:hypothetical protein